jgi:hypothetical protein
MTDIYSQEFEYWEQRMIDEQQNPLEYEGEDE